MEARIIPVQSLVLVGPDDAAGLIAEEDDGWERIWKDRR